MVSLDGRDYIDEEILQIIHFQEQSFEGELWRCPHLFLRGLSPIQYLG